MVNSRGGVEGIWNEEFARRLTTWYGPNPYTAKDKDKNLIKV
jgi:hypothetical protein